MLNNNFMMNLTTTRLFADNVVMPIYDILLATMKLRNTMLHEDNEKLSNGIQDRLLDSEIKKVNHLVLALKYEYVLSAVESIFPRLLRDIEDDKAHFLVEKEEHNFQKCFVCSLEYYLKELERANLQDQRAINLEKESMEVIKDVILFLNDYYSEDEEEKT